MTMNPFREAMSKEDVGFSGHLKKLLIRPLPKLLLLILP